MVLFDLLEVWDEVVEFRVGVEAILRFIEDLWVKPEISIRSEHFSIDTIGDPSSILNLTNHESDGFP